MSGKHKIGAPLPSDRQCVRKRREEGLPAPRYCAVCGLGKCKFDPPPYLFIAPNRLAGVTINQDGCAV